MMSESVLAIASGGMDSVVMLYDLAQQGLEVSAIGFEYGQSHARELNYLRDHCDALGLPLHVVDLRGVSSVFGESSITRPGSYVERSKADTVVPNRNMVFLSLAVSYAIAQGVDAVAYGCHRNDSAVDAGIHHDQRPEFVEAMRSVVALCDHRAPCLVTPYVGLHKWEVARRGAALGLDLSTTYSCHAGRHLHCGVCNTCRDRRAAMAKAGVMDNTVYESDAPRVPGYGGRMGRYND